MLARKDEIYMQEGTKEPVSGTPDLSAENTVKKGQNPLGTEPVKKLLVQFAIPSIIAMLVSSLYNIVDQFFIGRSVGELGNAATNISFPLSISCVAIALLFGIGGGSPFFLSLWGGKGEKGIDYF